MSWSAVRRSGVVVLCLALLANPAAFAQGGVIVEANVVRFDILEFQIEGNTVLPVEVIERALLPYLGERKQMDNVEAARAALEKAYQGAGFLTVFVDVPEQRVDEGVVVLSVTEGRVDRLSVSGSRYFSQGWIRAKVTEFAEGKVPNFNEVQRQLAQVNLTEDRRVQPIMRAGKVPGTVEAELKVDDRLPLSGSVEINNRHAADTKPLRLQATARYDNLFQLDHSVALTLVTAPEAPQQSRVVSLNYTIPGDEQAAFVGYVVNSNSSVAAIGDVNVLGSGTTVGLRYVRPVLNTSEESHSVTLGVDYKDLKQDTRSGSNVISTPLRYLPFVAAYSGSVEQSTFGRTLMTAQLVTAFRQPLRRDVACPGGTVDQFACNRQGGDGGFAALRGDLRHALPLGSVGTLRARLSGQVATGPLPSGEQYTIGGAESVRGYLEAEGAGDQALMGSVEWQSPDISAQLGRWFGGEDGDAAKLGFSASYVLAFFDAARAYVLDPAAGQLPHQSLAGGGIGLRTRIRKSLAGELDLAWPFKSTPATSSLSPRVHVRLALEY